MNSINKERICIVIRGMKWSLKIGNIAGIKILIHWTFAILLLWVGISQYVKGKSLNDSMFSILLILTIFLCVVLHELGHAFVAKKYGIQTRRIILLPIGGIADLEKLPSVPKHELLIALAGPAVNIVIASILYFVTPVKDIFLNPETIKKLSHTQLFWSSLFSINIMLALFNMIPAFPMDGGRVLRALLSMKLTRAQATKISANIGQFIAIIFVLLGLFYNPFLSLLGLFIFFSAYTENYMIQHQEFLSNFTVKDAMITNFTKISPDEIIKDISEKVIAGSETDFLVCENDRALGIVTYQLLLKALKENNGNVPVKNLMSTEFELIRADEHLDKIFMKLQRYKNAILPVMENHKVAGIINVKNINEFLMIRSLMYQ